MNILRLDQLPNTELYFRGLGAAAEDEFNQTNIMQPKEGDLSVGTGVFFSSSLRYAKTFAKKRVLVSCRELLDPQKIAYDLTDKYISQALFNDYAKRYPQKSALEVYAKILEHDTITLPQSVADARTYTARRPISKNSLLGQLLI